MFVVTLTYKTDLAKVDEHRAAHIDWLKQAYAEGLMIASGRQIPPVGGVLLMRGGRDAVEACIASDPFAIHDVAHYTLVEFTASMAAPGLEAMVE